MFYVYSVYLSLFFSQEFTEKKFAVVLKFGTSALGEQFNLRTHLGN